MSCKLELNKKTILFTLKIFGILGFTYFVILNNDLFIRFPNMHEGVTEFENLKDDPFFSSWQYVAIHTIKQLLHQFPVLRHENVVTAWVDASLIVTISGLLWSSLMCLLFYPNGFSLKKASTSTHIGFSSIIASMTLFQIVHSIQEVTYNSRVNMGDMFLWFPLFVIVSISLMGRMWIRINYKKTTLFEEVKLIFPFFIGIAIIACSWIPPISNMRFGTSIFIPIVEKHINLYTLIFSLAMMACCIALVQVHKKTVSLNERE